MHPAPDDAKANDELDTIDGVAHQSSSVPVTPPKSPTTPTDYVEPVSVDHRHYHLGEDIGSGGMGRVRRARDLRLGRDVAVKTLRQQVMTDVMRFHREARITAKLQHPAIIQVYEAGTFEGGEPFYAMPHVDGRRLDKVVKEKATLDERLGLVPHVIAVADAIAYAHSKNVIHRDIKPSNVLVGAFGETVVIDWGLSKDLGAPPDPQMSIQIRKHSSSDETSDGMVVGTPAYMPPEQARGEAVDRRADVYSIGAILYHLLVGASPYAGSPDSVIAAVKAGPCKPILEREPGTPVVLADIVMKAMAYRAIDRYADASELAADLRRFQTQQLVGAHHYTRWELFKLWVQKHRLPIGIGVTAVVTLAIMATVSVSRIVEEKRKQEQRRDTLLQERGRSEQLAGQSGRALAYLVEAARGNGVDGARGLLIADALRPFEAQLAAFETTGAPDSVAFGANGRVVALGEHNVQIFSTSSERAEHAFGNGGARSLLTTSDGRIITFEGDNSIIVWSTKGEHIRTLKGHTAEVLDAHLGSDNRTLVTGSADGTARAWDLETGVHRIAQCGDKLPVIAVRLSPNNQRVVSATDDNNMCYWAVADGQDVKPVRGHRGRIHTIRWNPNQERRQILTASDDGNVQLWDPFWGKPVISPITHDGRPIVSAEFSSDGRSVLTAGADQTARLWEIPDEIPVDNPTLEAKESRRFIGHSSALTAAIFDRNDERIATAGTDHKAKIWDVATGELLASFEHVDVVRSVAFAADGNRLLTASVDRTTRLWDLAKGVAQRPLEVDAVVHGVAVAPDGSIATAGDDSRVITWASPTAPAVKHYEHKARVLAVAFSPDGKWLASGGEEPVVILDRSTGKRARALGSVAPIRAIAFSRDSTQLVIAGEENGADVWAPATGERLRKLDHDVPLARIAISPDGTLIAGVDDRGRVVTWTAASASPQKVFPALTNGRTRAIAFSDDGQRLVASGTDTKIYAFGRELGRELVTVDGPTGEVSAVAFTRDGGCVITAGVDGLVQIWDADKGRLVATRGVRGSAIHALALSPDGATLWVGGADQLARSWDIHTEQRSVDALAPIVERVPWRLDDIDVVRKYERSP